MSHSTIKTWSYVLSKYSRAYPVKRIPQGPTHNHSKTQESAREQLTPEWQHYTNPIIRILLDTKIASNKDIESVRLRIVWQINPTEGADPSQPDVVFEDMDLLSFASIMPPVPQKHQTEGLPLKAVYRDTVVGIRYFYSREDGITPIYRRFQISFQSSSDASNFIALIKPVCPCRMNPSAGAPIATAQSQLMPRPSIQHKSSHTTSNSVLPHRGSPLVRVKSGILPSGLPVPPSRTSPQNHLELLSIPLLVPLSSSLRQEPLSDLGSHFALGSTSSPAGFSQESGRHQSLLPIKTVPKIAQYATQSTDPRSSSAQSETPNAMTNPTPNSSVQVNNNQDELHSALTSFVETTSLYDLSDASLERLIAKVIHEDEFITLVEKISKMMIIRRIANV